MGATEYRSYHPMCPGPDPLPSAASVEAEESVDESLSTWVRAGALVDLDYENDRFYVNGVEYADVAAMVAAGVYDTTAPVDRMPSTAWQNRLEMIIVAEATTGVNDDASLEYLCQFDDNDAVLNDELLGLRRNVTSDAIQIINTVASSTTASVTTGTMADSTRFRVAASCRLNDIRGSLNGATPVTDVVVTLSTLLARFLIGDQIDGLRPWEDAGGVIHRITIYGQFIAAADNADLQAVATMGNAAALTGQKNDRAYSWWMYPLAKTRLGMTSIGTHAGQSTDQTVLRIENATLRFDPLWTRLTTVNAKDEHSSAAVDFLPDGRMITAYTGHDDNGIVGFRRSTDASPANFGAEVDIASGSGLVSTTYAQIHQHGGKIWVLVTEGTPNWDIFESADNGDTWTRKKRIITMTGMPTLQQVYLYPGNVSSSVARYFVLPHPANVQNELKLFEWDKSNGELSDEGGVLGDIDSGTVGTAILAFATLPTIRTPAANRSQRLLDVSDDGSMVVLVDFVTADDTDAQYYIGILTGASRWVAGDWTFRLIVAAGVPFYAASHYFGGVSFARESHSGVRLYVSRESAGTWFIDQMDSSDQGQNWVTTNLKSSTTMLLRPISPHNATANLPVIWQRATTYTDFNVWTMNIEWTV